MQSGDLDGAQFVRKLSSKNDFWERYFRLKPTFLNNHQTVYDLLWTIKRRVVFDYLGFLKERTVRRQVGCKDHY